MGSPYYIYIVNCEDGTLYTGITVDVVRRLAEHRGLDGKGAKYTRNRGVCGLAGLWCADDRSSASILEYRIKHLSRKEKDELIAHPSRVKHVIADAEPSRFHYVSAPKRRALWERLEAEYPAK